MQNPILKLTQSSYTSEKPGCFPEKLKTWWAPTTIEFNIFYWNFAHVSVLPMSTQECSGFLYFF